MFLDVLLGALCMPHPLCALGHSCKLCAHPDEELLARITPNKSYLCRVQRERESQGARRSVGSLVGASSAQARLMDGKKDHRQLEQCGGL